ncbi:unnamed protein product, partial [Amoebophrya sp. A120]|eukprot:GSA120T00008588001.1
MSGAGGPRVSRVGCRASRGCVVRRHSIKPRRAPTRPRCLRQVRKLCQNALTAYGATRSGCRHRQRDGGGAAPLVFFGRGGANYWGGARPPACCASWCWVRGLLWQAGGASQGAGLACGISLFWPGVFLSCCAAPVRSLG